MRQCDIVRQLVIPRLTVSCAIKRYQELGNSQDRPRSGRPLTAVTPENINKVRCRIRRSTEQSMGKMAKDLKISVRKIVKVKLGLRNYKLNRAYFLHDRMKLQRLQKCQKMQRLVANGRLAKVLFTDEKIFTVQPYHNSQNHRQLLRKKGLAAKLVERSLFPRSVMVWAGICANGRTPLVFIDRNVKINAAVYQNDILSAYVHPWAQEHLGENQFSLQQDWAPVHGARTTIQFCEELFPGFWGKDVLPSNSPDLNPMDYSIWSILEQKLGRTQYASTEALKAALQRAWDEIDEQQCATIVGNLQERLAACISARGAQLEHLL